MRKDIFGVQYVGYTMSKRGFMDYMNYRFDDAPDTVRYAMQMFVNEKEVMPKIKKVIFNAPATIVMWEDGTKTVVKCSECTSDCSACYCMHNFDKEKGLAMAIIKKIMGNKGNYNNLFKKWCEEDKGE